MNREKMALRTHIHSSYIRYGITSTEPDGWWHGAKVGSPRVKRTWRKGDDVRDRIKV